MNDSLPSRLLLGLPGLAMAAAALSVASEGADAARLLQATLNALGVALVWAVAVVVHQRHPQRRLGLLLFVLAGAHTIQSLAASADPVLHTLARVTRPVVELLLAWAMLAYPSGRLRSRGERLFIGVAALCIVLLWLPGVMLTPRIPFPGAHVLCQGECPRNVLMLADEPAVAQPLFELFRAIGALAYLLTMVLLAGRFRRATPFGRRALLPVVAACVARSLNVAVFLGTGAFAVGLVFTFWCVPVAIIIGDLRTRSHVTRSLVRLVTGLRARPTAQELRSLMAVALDDPQLVLAVRLDAPERWVDAEGRGVDLPPTDTPTGRVATLVRGSDGRAVAALVHDAALLDEPVLVESVTHSLLVMLESHRIEAEWRVTSASAISSERERIERGLHDGAQQRLIALRIKLSVTARLIATDPQRAARLVQELDHDVAAAIAELRAFAQGVLPPVLVARGLAAALSEVLSRLHAPTVDELQDVGRFDPSVEEAVYFCCIEALQNAAKHAGTGVMVRAGLACDGRTLRFWVEDDGQGFAQARTKNGGRGLANMHARMEAVGGQLTIGSSAGGGVRVGGSVPVSTVPRATAGPTSRQGAAHLLRLVGNAGAASRDGPQAPLA